MGEATAWRVGPTWQRKGSGRGCGRSGADMWARQVRHIAETAATRASGERRLTGGPRSAAAEASARREVAAGPGAGFELSGRWGELGLAVERARPSAGPCGREKRAGPRGLGWVAKGFGLDWEAGWAGLLLLLFYFSFSSQLKTI